MPSHRACACQPRTAGFHCDKNRADRLRVVEYAALAHGETLMVTGAGGGVGGAYHCGRMDTPSSGTGPGLVNVGEVPFVISFDYTSFEDYWSSFSAARVRLTCM
jgi:hypothetical protein